MKLASNTNQTVVEDEPVHSSLASTDRISVADGPVPRLFSNTNRTVVENDES